MASITLQQLVKQYDDVTAVDGIDLEVRDGEFLVLVGPSGCGKSTTLRMIAGLEDITDGTLQIGSAVVNEVPPEDRNVAMVFQNYALYPHMTAARNMKFGMKSVSEFSDAEIDDRVREAAETLGISGLLDRKPKELSGGERQRVAIGRALVREPTVFLLDEPLSNLDAKLRVQMRAELLKLHDELATTTVYVTHDQTEAMTLGDRVAVMDDGEVQQVDPPQRLYDYPENKFVAGFIGEPAMNTFAVRVDRREGGYVADQGGFSVTLPEGEGLPRAEATEVELGVRPEDISLAANVLDRRETFRATVTVREPLGELLLLHCQAGQEEFRVKVQPRTDLQPGDTVEIGFNPERLHLFEGDSGEAIYHSASQPVSEAATPE